MNYEAYVMRKIKEKARQQKAVEDGYGNMREPEETAFEAGYQAGAFAMRERAAKVCDSVNNYDNPMTASDCSDAIRALPIE